MTSFIFAPANHEHFIRLMAFTCDVLAVSDELGIEPVLDGSLAVFAYTRDPSIEVHDIDFSCAEADFPRLCKRLGERGIHCEIRSWHVLQARRDGLKVEFGAIEHWMPDIPVEREPVTITGLEIRIVTLDGLREQYRRGLDNTASGAVDDDPAKRMAIKAKLRLLDSMRSASFSRNQGQWYDGPGLPE